MRPLSAWRMLAALLLSGSMTALAEPIGYVAGFDTLYRVDLSTGQSTRIGPDRGIGFVDIEALAFSPAGVLFGVADGGRYVGSTTTAATDFLVRVSTTTGVGALVAQLPGLQGQGVGATDALDYAMAFACNGSLWLASASTTRLWQVDPATAAVTAVGELGVPIAGMAARGGVMYGLSIDPNPSLFRIDTATAQATLIGPLGVAGPVGAAGLAFDADGRLWGTLDGRDLNPTRIVRIDPATGAATVVGAISLGNGSGAKALAIAPPGGCGAAVASPIPGPGLPALLILVAVAAGVGARRLAVR